MTEIAEESVVALRVRKRRDLATKSRCYYLCRETLTELDLRDDNGDVELQTNLLHYN